MKNSFKYQGQFFEIKLKSKSIFEKSNIDLLTENGIVSKYDEGQTEYSDGTNLVFSPYSGYIITENLLREIYKYLENVVVHSTIIQ